MTLSDPDIRWLHETGPWRYAGDTQSYNSEYTPWLYTHQASVFALMSGRRILARNMKRLRKERGMSQEELAHLAEIDRTYVSALERCLYAASIDVMDKISEALGVKVDILLQSSK